VDVVTGGTGAVGGGEVEGGGGARSQGDGGKAESARRGASKHYHCDSKPGCDVPEPRTVEGGRGARSQGVKGEEYPDTIRVMADLAYTKRALGQNNAAIDLMSELIHVMESRDVMNVHVVEHSILERGPFIVAGRRR
jgi:hypothetical protein